MIFRNIEQAVEKIFKKLEIEVIHYLLFDEIVDNGIIYLGKKILFRFY